LAAKDGIVNKLWVTALMVAALGLAAGSPAPAQTAVGYGGVVSQNPAGGAGKLGSSVKHTYGSAKKKGSWHKRSKAKG
jgi:hypothetical protein